MRTISKKRFDVAFAGTMVNLDSIQNISLDLLINPIGGVNADEYVFFLFYF